MFCNIFDAIASYLLEQVKAWSKDDYGKFYNGDSYIILNTYKEKDSEASFVQCLWLYQFLIFLCVGVAL